MREIEPSEVPYEVGFFFTEKTTISKFWLPRMLPPYKETKQNRLLSIALTFFEHGNLAFWTKCNRRQEH